MGNYIIMADTIDSRSYEAKELYEDLNMRVNEANATYGEKVLSPLTITLGDEFQGVTTGSVASIEILLKFEEEAFGKADGAQLRWVIWYGNIDTPINSDIAHGMLGPGLSEARNAVNSLKKRNMPRLLAKMKNSNITNMMNDALLIYDSIISRWDDDDKEMVGYFLKFEDYKLVADHLGKTRSQVWKRKNNLNIEGYMAIRSLMLKIASIDG